MLSDDADVSVTTTQLGLSSILTTKIDTLIETSKIEGDSFYLELFASNLVTYDASETVDFNLIEP